MEAVEGKVQRKAQDQNSEFEQESEFQGQESLQLFADPDDGEQRKATQAAANNSSQVQQLMTLQSAVGQSAQVQQTAQLQAAAQQFSGQPKSLKAAQKNGLPDQLKSRIESLSGFSMDDVKVHYNSSKPAEVGALAYALGNNIYIGAGQEAHLPHEAWHVVQQKQGRVKPTTQAENGAAVNDNPSLEQEADKMGAKAMQQAAPAKEGRLQEAPLNGSGVSIQKMPENIGDPTGYSDGLHSDKLATESVNGNIVPEHVISIAKNPEMGSKPSIAIPGWSWLQNHVGRLKGKWVRFHLINENLGGSGNDPMNLVPTSVAVNNQYEREIEHEAKEIAKDQWTYIDVKMIYDAEAPAPIPKRFTASYGSWNPMESRWEVGESSILVNPDFQEIASGLSYIRGSNITQTQLDARGVPSAHKKDFQQWLQEYRLTTENDDEGYLDDQFGRDAATEFGDYFDFDWIKEKWLDEDVEAPGQYQVVVKALDVKRKRKRAELEEEDVGPLKKKAAISDKKHEKD